MVQREVKKAKLDYLQNKIEENKQDSKKLWQNLKSLGLKNKKRKEQESVIKIDGELCHDKMAIADEFQFSFHKCGCQISRQTPPFQRLFQRKTMIVFVTFTKEKVYVKTASSYYQSVNNLFSKSYVS